MQYSIFIGYDKAETEAFAVCRRSLRTHGDLAINPLDLSELRRVGLYWRPTEKRNGQLWDMISDAPMSTEFACSRFLTPILARTGIAVFMDCDIYARDYLDEMFELIEVDPSKAVWCVKHDYTPKNATKMDGLQQTTYSRKNWSSVMAFNVDHPSNRKLTVDVVNSWPGRDLHAFKWLADDEIGALPAKFNHLVGVTPDDPDNEPVLVHFTNAGPWHDSYQPERFGAEWVKLRREWLAENTYIPGRPFTWGGIKVSNGDMAYLR